MSCLLRLQAGFDLAGEQTASGASGALLHGTAFEKCAQLIMIKADPRQLQQGHLQRGHQTALLETDARHLAHSEMQSHNQTACWPFKYKGDNDVNT